ncbi:MAG: T9SS type A sorting domain-containing protein [Bacteroidota bacterium]
MIKNTRFIWIKVIVLFIGLIAFRAEAQNYSIILGRPTNTSITASVLFSQTAQFYLEYGTLSGIYTNSSSIVTASANATTEIDLTNLNPNTQYYYRMQFKPSAAGNYSASTQYSFYTQRSAGSTFTFTIESDEHLYDKKGVESMYKITLNNQANDHPDFMLTLGDIFGDDHRPNTITSAQLDSLHRVYRPRLGAICNSIPFYVCLGNHEGEKDYYLKQNPPNNMAVHGTLWRKFYYPNPFPNTFYTGDTLHEGYGVGQAQNYYAWTWGDALFVVMDVYRYDCDTSAKPHYWDWTLGKMEYDWLKQTLETSTAKYKFAFAHHIRGEDRGGVTNAKLYEWGGYDGATGTTYSFPTKRPGWAKPIHKLFVDNGVNIFFQGHDHLFAHEVLDNVVYQEVPMAADSTYKIGMLANASAYVSDTIDGTGHIRVIVSPACVKVDYVKAYLPADTLNHIHHNREIGFSYTLGNCGTAGIQDYSLNDLVNAFPNPVNQKLFLQFLSPLENHICNIRNQLGEILISSTEKEIDVSSLQNGLYFVCIQNGPQSTVKKIIVNH